MMKKHRVLLGGLLFFLLLNMTMCIWAATPPIAVSNSYRNGPYYTKLCNTLDQYANASQRERFIQIALSQKGYKASSTSGINSGDGNGLGEYCEYMYQINPGQYGNNWCAAFVSWCARMAGLPENVVPSSAAVGTFRDQASSYGTAHRLWSDDFSTYIDYKPEPGDLILHMPYNGSTGYNYNAWTPSAHIAIIASVSNTRASDGGWTITTIERGGSVSSGVTMATLGNTVWYRTVSTKANAESGSHLYQMIVHPNWQDQQDTVKPVVTNVRVSNLSKAGYTVTCSVSDNAGVARVAFPTWTSNGWQDDIVWQYGVLSNGTATFRVNVSDHGNQFGQYLTYIYAYDYAGNCSLETESTKVSVNVPEPDTIKPVISNVRVTNLSKDGYTVTCNVSDNVGVVRVAFPTWTSEGWKDDILWSNGTINNGTASFRVKTSDHGNQHGKYYTYLYAYDADGNVSVETKETQVSVNVPEPDTKKPVISNVRVTNISKDGYTITCDVSDNVGVVRVAFPTWTSEGWKDDILWSDGTINNGAASFRVKTSDHGNQYGKYYTYIYAYDAEGNISTETEETQVNVNVPEPDMTKPVISNIRVTNISKDGYTVTCSVSDNTNVVRVAFPTWTLEDWQDDILWSDGTINNGAASFRVKTSDHGNQYGKYYTYIYAYDAEGNISTETEETRISVEVPEPDTIKPVISNVSVADVSKDGYTITCSVSDNVGVARVEFSTWTSENGVDDILWEDGTIDNGIVSYRVKTADHDSQSGKYYTKVYAYDAAGNISVETNETQISVDVPAPDMENPVISNSQAINVSQTGYDISCEIADNVGVTKVEFVTWTIGYGQHPEEGKDDLVRHEGTISGNIVTGHVNVTDHNSEGGTYRTDIYVYDKAGNEAYDYVTVIVPLVPSQVILSVSSENTEDQDVRFSWNEADNANCYDLYIYNSDGSEYAVKRGLTVLYHSEKLLAGSYSAMISSVNSTYGTRTNSSTVSFTVNQNVLPKEYTITYHLDGGDNAAANPQSYFEGDRVSLSDPTKDQYTFEGWYLSEAGGEKFKNGELYNRNLDLYARWKKKEDTSPTGEQQGTQENEKATPGTQQTEQPNPVTQQTEQSKPAESRPSTPFAPKKDIYGNIVVTETQKEQQILSQPNDNDPTGSTFSLLQAKAKKAAKKSISLTWKRVPGASSYSIFGNKCGKGKKYRKIAVTKGTSFTQKGLAKGTYYKYLIVANGGGKALATSKTIHVATAGGKVGNAKSIKVNKKKVSLKVKKTFRVKAKAVPKSSKKKMKKHRAIAFETTNPKVATVDKKGKIKAVGKGKCKIYAYAQNGVCKAISVTVK